MYDVVVVGAGHAGIEACLAASRMNKKTAIVTLSKDMIGSMPCNPSVGGPAKGIVVREIDALGGMMPVAADKTALQFKMLNTTKGPGVWSLRVQSDKIAYKRFMKKALEEQDNLDIIEAACKIVVIKDGKACGVELEDGTFIESKTVVLTTGTYMASNVLRGHTSTVSGPEDQRTVNTLSESLREAGIKTFRLKTGTPARIKMDTIDFSKTEPQPGTNQFLRFSETTKQEDVLPFEKQEICHLIYTQPETHEIIHTHLHDSAMYSGLVKGVGPRYCPSIEDKIVRFSSRDRHPIFVEPEGRWTTEVSINGFSSSLPEDVQYKALKEVPGFENMKMITPAYAIEYDYFPSTQLFNTLETKIIKNLYFAGQVNGTTGYEEAACQGLVAGVNAHLKINDKEPLNVTRTNSYIGVLVDDLVTKENDVEEPYRMFTSRAEFRISLRNDNADCRLSQMGYEIGLLSQERYDQFLEKEKNIEQLKNSLNIKLNPGEISQCLNTNETKMETVAALIQRPHVTLHAFSKNEKMAKIIGNFDKEVVEAVEVEIKYAAYIEKEKELLERFQKLNEIRIADDFDYDSIKNYLTKEDKG